jgi:hypothetical protein
MASKFSHFERLDYRIEKFKIGKVWFFWNPEPIYWYDTDGVRHEIRRGLVSDGFSVPAFLWPLIMAFVNVLAALLHDLQYLLGTPQAEADENIRLGISQTHPPECWWPWWRRWKYSARVRYEAFKVWLGLRIGGSVAWKHYDAMRRAGIDVTKNRFANTLEEAKEMAKWLIQ